MTGKKGVSTASIDNSLEKNVEAALVEEMESIGAFIHKIRTTGLITPNGFAHNPDGLGDLDYDMCYKGYFYALETKSKAGRLRKGQELKIKRIQLAKGRARKIKSYEDIRNLKNELLSLPDLPIA